MTTWNPNNSSPDGIDEPQRRGPEHAYLRVMVTSVQPPQTAPLSPAAASLTGCVTGRRREGGASSQ